MLPIACWSTQAFLPGCEPVLSWSCLLPYCVLLSPVISWAHGGAVFATGESMSCLTLHPVPSDARAKLASIVRKPSVYAGKNEPTAVYDAALSSVCQPKNRDLFCFWLVFPRFSLISSVFP
jgi:hypothetical protein